MTTESTTALTKQLNFRIDKELRDTLVSEAGRLRTTPSAIVREALVRDFERRDAANPGQTLCKPRKQS